MHLYRILSVFVSSLLLSGVFFSAQASPTPDEGMWLPLYLKEYNEKTMKSLGLKLDADDIYSTKHKSLKDAIVRIGDGTCTGEIVSATGLVFTNHHCGFESVATLSSKENDLLKNGFWAKSIGEEIPLAGLKFSILREMRDITSEISDKLNEVKNPEIRQIRKDILFDSVVGICYCQNRIIPHCQRVF